MPQVTSDGRVKLLDFGLAATKADVLGKLQTNGSAAGQPPSMAAGWAGALFPSVAQHSDDDSVNSRQMLHLAHDGLIGFERFCSIYAR